jgi:hypothetical protein
MEAIAVALELGNDINAVDQNGETAMHGAAYKNLPGAVRPLARRGAKREIWDRKSPGRVDADADRGRVPVSGTSSRRM